MNKANKFKRRTYSHNENLTNYHTNTHTNDSTQLISDPAKLHTNTTKFNTTAQKQNAFYQTGEVFPIHKLSSGARRIKTEQFQIQPFTQIQNLVSLNSQSDQNFIKTKRLKLYPKARSCHKQINLDNQSITKSRKFQTNFQILKKQIQQLQSLQILRPSYESKQNNPQIFYESQSYLKQYSQAKFESQFGLSSQFIAKGQFNKGKNVCLLQKQRQNIKKIMKNKRFRNYINPHKATKLNTTTQKPPQQNPQNHLKSLSNQNPQKPSPLTTLLDLSKSLTNQTMYDFKVQKLKKKQTPQIVKKYYRPQSCTNKRNTPTHNSKNVKIQLSNYISYGAVGGSSVQKGRGQGYGRSSSVKSSKDTVKDRKELIIVY